MSDQPEPENRNIYVHEGLGITSEKMTEINKVIIGMVSENFDITDIIENLSEREGWTHNERLYAVFSAGYTIHDLDMMQEAMNIVEQLFE